VKWGADMKDRGRLWVDDKISRIAKNIFLKTLDVLHKLIKPYIKMDRNQIRNERVRFFYDCFTELINREHNKAVKERFVKLRDFVILLLDDDRAYRYRAYLLAVIFFNRIGEFYILSDDWYLTDDDKAKFERIKNLIR